MITNWFSRSFWMNTYSYDGLNINNKKSISWFILSNYWNIYSLIKTLSFVYQWIPMLDINQDLNRIMIFSCCLSNFNRILSLMYEKVANNHSANDTTKVIGLHLIMQKVFCLSNFFSFFEVTRRSQGHWFVRSYYTDEL